MTLFSLFISRDQHDCSESTKIDGNAIFKVGYVSDVYTETIMAEINYMASSHAQSNKSIAMISFAEIGC